MRYLVLVGILAILGCSSEPDQEDGESVLLESAKEPLEKAEAVEGVVLDSTDRIDEAVGDADE